MAAGAYKGLTIRIGADTTKLSTALRSANSVIFKTQSELTKLTKALRLDPGNQNAAALQMGRLSEQTTNVAHSIDVLKQGIGELGTTATTHFKDGKLIDGESVAELAANTESATLKAKEWADAYNKVDGELEQIYASIKKATDGEVDLRKITNEGNYSDNLLKELEEQGLVTRQQAEEIRALKPAWNEARAEMENYANVAKLGELNDNLALQQSRIRDVANAYADGVMKSDLSKSTQPMTEYIERMSSATEKAQGRFERLNRAAQINPTSISTAASKAKALSEATEAARTKAEGLRKQIDAYKTAGTADLAKQIGNASVAYEEAKQSVADLKVQLELAEQATGGDVRKADELREALARAEAEARKIGQVNELNELETQLHEVEASAKSMSDSMKVGLGDVGVAAVQAATEVGNLARQIGTNIVESSNEIDSSYRDLRKTFDGTEEQYEQLYDAAMKYSQAHVTSADTMLEMEAIAAQLGVGIDDSGKKAEDAADRIQKFADAAANLDVATDIDSDTIALQMGQIMNVMSDVSTDNIDKFADALVRLGNNMPTQESNIMQITQRLSAIGDVAHFSTPELLGWAAAIASTGQRSEAAASGIATTITNISKAVSAGDGGLSEFASKAGVSVNELAKAVETGSDKLKEYAAAAGVAKKDLSDAVDQTKLLEKYAELAGMSTETFVEKWRNDPSDTLKAFVTGLKDSGDELFATLMDLDINGVRQNQTLASLAQTVGRVTNAVDMADNAFNGLDDGFGDAGDAAREASRKAEGFSGSLAKLQNSTKVMWASLGDTVKPYLDMLADGVQSVTEFMNGLDDSTKDLIVRVGVMTAAFATAQPIIAALQGHFGKLAAAGIAKAVASFGKVKAYADTTSNVFVALGNGLSAIKGKFASFVTGAKGVGDVLISLGASGTIAAGAVGAVAAAVGVYYIDKMLKAKKYTDDFNKAVSDITGVTNNLAQDIYSAGNAVESYGKKWSAARVDMEDYHKSLKENTDAQMDARDSMVASVGELERYQEIIDKAAGKGERYAGSLGELQWAVDKLNELTGESWTVQDVLSNKYLDETNAVKSTKEAIDKLIEARKKDAQIAGYEKILSENIAAQEKNRIARETAANAYQDWIDMKLESGAKAANPLTNSMTDTEYIKWLQDNDEHTQQLLLDSKNLRYENKLLKESYEEAALALGGLTEAGSYAISENMGERESIIRLSDDFREVASVLGFTNDEFTEFAKTFALRMQECGVSTKQFSDSDLKELSAQLLESDGDMNTVLRTMLEWAALDMPDKYANVYLDENGDLRRKIDDIRVEWSEAANDFVPIELDADTTQFEAAAERARKAVEGESATMRVGADTEEASSKVDEAKSMIQSNPVELQVDTKTNDSLGESDLIARLNELSGTPFNIDVNVRANAEGYDEVITALDNLPGVKDVNVNVKAPGISSKAKAISDLNKAAGSMNGAKATYTASGNATKSSTHKNIESLNKAGASMEDEKATYTAAGNAASGAAAAHVWDLYRAISALPREKTTTITTRQITEVSKVQKATGTYIDPNHMPRHAAGIFTRPTLTNIGWVGEDGAELYSGNSLVPLTNRKYSMPYINDISDAVARKMGGAGKTTTINLSVSCEGDPNDTANAIVRALELLDL